MEGLPAVGAECLEHVGEGSSSFGRRFVGPEDLRRRGIWVIDAGRVADTVAVKDEISERAAVSEQNVTS